MTKPNKVLTAVAAAFIFAAAFCVPSRADDGRSGNPAPLPGVSLGGRAAYFWPKSTDADNGNWFGGAQLRGHLWKWFAVEGSVDYQRRHLFGDTVNVDVYPVQVSGLVYLTPQYRLSPLILGGVGWYFTHASGPGGLDTNDNRFGQHVGGGLQFFATRHWSIDATYRYIFTSDFDATRNGQNVRVNGNGHQVTGGINYHF